MEQNNSFSIDKLFQLVLSFDYKSLTVQKIKEFATRDQKNACNYQSRSTTNNVYFFPQNLIESNFNLTGIIGFLAFYLCVGWGNDFLCNLIGFVWPAYQS